jgi:hypothetical protein
MLLVVSARAAPPLSCGNAAYACPVSNRAICSPATSKRHLVRIAPQVEFE